MAHGTPDRLTPRFGAGLVFATPAATSACTREHLLDCLARHLRGDWGLTCAEDREQNEIALREGYRVLSVYAQDPAKDDPDARLWILTEADRSVTTLLLPDDY